ncbi:MnhB domain-containing protein [Caloramator proteoclasticus]|uniref:Multicomponent Na+:H+ antiporter subunit B n=1 Tax=Caloramator proteoclasticus DSM 10124 TaxID=1121262 RepID=A0A1M4TFE7_9CLOT|nr:MnhB domain-containing protein [Caloramator proteoclasticus]SHE43017.1 multicomponent Na+:H+ antiporter subunit B [Caloramator proteoclasticus DSM 10124]
MSNKNIKVKDYIIKSAADFFTPIGLVLGLYIILHGHLSPGGGFQGGVIVASAVVLIYLGYGYEKSSSTFKPNILKKSEAIGALMYTFFALLGIFYAANFCRNVFFNIGNPGDLFSSGTIFLMNAAVGYKVLTGVGFLILLMFGLLGNKEA